MEARRTIAWNIRRIRVEKGLTIEELADRAHIDASSVARIERAAINTTVRAVEKIADALGVMLVDLVADPPKGGPPKPLPPGRRPSKRIKAG